MYSALAGVFVLMSIGILLAHAMEGYWPTGRPAAILPKPRAPGDGNDAAGS